MAEKYFCWSIDDGVEQDKKITEILRKYHMGATFNLNSGLFGARNYEGRIMNYGLKQIPYEKFHGKRHLLPYVEHFRIKEDEVYGIYEGFEIASHTLEHKNLTKCSDEELKRQITEDVKNLRELFHQSITGFVYPYGAVNEKAAEILKDEGIVYARAADSDPSFRFPEDPMKMRQTCWHIDKKALQTVDTFINEKRDEDMFFMMFAHGYEFDFGTRESNWDKFEEICRRVSGRDDIICCSVSDALRMHGRQL